MQRGLIRSSCLFSGLQALAVVLLCGVTQVVDAESFNYISAMDLKQQLESPNKPMLVDIQVKTNTLHLSA